MMAIISVCGDLWSGNSSGVKNINNGMKQNGQA